MLTVSSHVEQNAYKNLEGVRILKYYSMYKRINPSYSEVNLRVVVFFFNSPEKEFLQWPLKINSRAME